MEEQKPLMTQEPLTQRDGATLFVARTVAAVTLDGTPAVIGQDRIGRRFIFSLPPDVAMRLVMDLLREASHARQQPSAPVPSTPSYAVHPQDPRLTIHCDDVHSVLTDDHHPGLSLRFGQERLLLPFPADRLPQLRADLAEVTAILCRMTGPQ